VDESEDEVRRIARETVSEDLKDWQERYTKAADEGATEIEERVEEISKHMIRRQARTMGKSLLQQLRTSVVTETEALRRTILEIVGAVNNGSATAEDAHEQIISVVRRTGMAIKERAQDVRMWRENYEAELHESVTKAAENHFKILDSIRDLALQKIGMKWAWMDGITYRDWAKYHELKDRFDEWQGDLEKLIITHPSLEAAQDEGAKIEDEAMEIAQSAAKELARLKQVARWKLIAGDATNDFDSDTTKEAAEAAESLLTGEAVKSPTDPVGEAASNPECPTSHATKAVEIFIPVVENDICYMADVLSSFASETPSAGFESKTLVAGNRITCEAKVSPSIANARMQSEQCIPSNVKITPSESPDDGTLVTNLLSGEATYILSHATELPGNTAENEEGPAPLELPVVDAMFQEPEITVPTEEQGSSVPHRQ
jgi:hypothetical protein